MVKHSREDIENLLRNISMSTGLSEEQLQGSVDYLVGARTVEDELLQKIVYIGNELPESLVTDTRPKFVVLGTPQEFIDACK